MSCWHLLCQQIQLLQNREIGTQWFFHHWRHWSGKENDSSHQQDFNIFNQGRITSNVQGAPIDDAVHVPDRDTSTATPPHQDILLTRFYRFYFSSHGVQTFGWRRSLLGCIERIECLCGIFSCQATRPWPHRYFTLHLTSPLRNTLTHFWVCVSSGYYLVWWCPSVSISTVQQSMARGKEAPWRIEWQIQANAIITKKLIEKEWYTYTHLRRREGGWSTTIATLDLKSINPVPICTLECFRTGNCTTSFSEKNAKYLRLSLLVQEISGWTPSNGLRALSLCWARNSILMGHQRASW